MPLVIIDGLCRPENTRSGAAVEGVHQSSSLHVESDVVGAVAVGGEEQETVQCSRLELQRKVGTEQIHNNRTLHVYRLFKTIIVIS